MDAPKGPRPKGTSQVGLSKASMLQKGFVPREAVKLVYPVCRCSIRAPSQGNKSVCPKCRCSKRALSQGNQSSWSVPSIGAPEEPRPKGTSQVGLSQVSMLQKSLVPREQVGVSQVWMLQKGLVPREPVKLVCPKRQCFKRALSQGNQSSWSVQSVDASKGLCPKGSSEVGLSQVSMLHKSLVPREQVGVSQVSMLQKGLVPGEAVK